jgi:hypothetical protein
MPFTHSKLAGESFAEFLKRVKAEVQKTGRAATFDSGSEWFTRISPRFSGDPRPIVESVNKFTGFAVI